MKTKKPTKKAQRQPKSYALYEDGSHVELNTAASQLKAFRNLIPLADSILTEASSVLAHGRQVKHCEGCCDSMVALTKIADVAGHMISEIIQC